ALDANDCAISGLVWIHVPLQVKVELGDNITIARGDSTTLQAIVNIPADSLSAIFWSGSDSLECPQCLTRIVAPVITTGYTVSVTTTDGCTDADTLTVLVKTDRQVYIPNVFTPNGDGLNDKLLISAGDEVGRIASMTVFDRWGNMVFQARDLQPGDAAGAWDGRLRGVVLPSAVYAYRLEVVFRDGHRERFYGDVTLLR